MSYSEILGAIGTSPSISHRLFEGFVFCLLRTLTERQHRRHPVAAPVLPVDVGIDFLLPEGVEPLEKVETSVILKFLPVYSGRHVDAVLSARHAAGAPILLVVSGKPNRWARESLASAGSSITVWDFDDIEAHVSNLGDQWVKEVALPELERLRLDIILPKIAPTPDKWITARAEHIRRLHERYDQNRLVIVTGAGLSVGAGLKTWADLLNSLAAKVIASRLSGVGSHLPQLVRRFVELSDSNPLILARYLRSGLGPSFTDQIADVLYGDGTASYTSDAYKSISRLCVPRRTGPGVKAIINYNYDDLLYQHVREANVEVRVLYRMGDRADPPELPLLHVHGFLPRRTPGAAMPPAPEGLVLSEEEYHTLYLDSYHWANIAQLGYFLNDTCLIIGHSLTDPNLRRLLSIAATHNSGGGDATGLPTKPKHFAILRRWSSESFTHSNVPTNINPDGTLQLTRTQVVAAPEAVVRNFISAHHAAEENLYAELGLNIVWVEDWKELPQVIDAIRTGAPLSAGTTT